MVDLGRRWEQKAYAMTADGRNVRALKSFGNVANAIWSVDGKYVYISGGRTKIYKSTADGSSTELLIENGFIATETTPDGKYLLGKLSSGDDTAIYAYSLEEKKRITLLPGVTTFLVRLSPDGKYLLYATEGTKEIIFYRVGWKDGKLTGPPEVALKVPFAFAFEFNGNAYDYSRDLSTIIFSQPTMQADLYLLSY
jgi:hypothetical protein